MLIFCMYIGYIRVEKFFLSTKPETVLRDVYTRVTVLHTCMQLCLHVRTGIAYWCCIHMYAIQVRNSGITHV